MLFKSRENPGLVRRVRLWMWPRTAWSRSVRYVWRRLWRLTASPHAIAIGCSAGVFASFTPFMGLHFVIAAALAWGLGGNILASALGTFFGNPLSFPFIWFSTYNLGGIILMEPKYSHVDFAAELMHASFANLWHLIKPMMVGGIPLGIFFGLVVYFPVRAAVASYQQRRGKARDGQLPAE